MKTKSVMNDRFFAEKGFTIHTDQSAFDRDYMYAALRRAYWAAELERDTFERSLRNALCFGLFKGQKQLGFARVITDRATFGYLADVFIDEDHRGTGLGKWLIQTILRHPDLQGLRRILLATADAQALYAAFGFKPLEKPESYMSIRHHRAKEVLPV